MDLSLQDILRELNGPDTIANVPRRIRLCEIALQQIEKDQDPAIWAGLRVELGLNLHRYHQEIRGDNLERAIEIYKDALQVMTQQAMPVQWSATITYLGVAYTERIQGERAENIERAIDLYKQALQVRTRRALPIEWAQTASILANAYTERIQGERAENLERAIGLYKQVLQIRTKQAMPDEWSNTTVNLALAYSERIRGRRIENLERAIQLLEQVLQVRTRDVTPVEWATTSMNLANIYSERIEGQQAENLERAIDLYYQSLQVLTRQTTPIEWARTKMNLASAYWERARGERDANLEQAIEYFKQAQQVMTYEWMPLDWAAICLNLANAYVDRISGIRADNLEHAIELNEQALLVITNQTFPAEWAKIVTNLSTVYIERIRGERSENLEQAIDLLNQALQVRTEHSMPFEWANTTMNLATAYLDRVRGVRAENLEKAIELIESSLKVMTRRSMPVDWAEATMNLANAYADRVYGERAENLERAIKLYHQALQVRTLQDSPFEWVMTTMNLATVYWERIRGKRTENLEKSINLYDQILKSITVQSMPLEWAEVTVNLATAYFARLRGKPLENLNRASALYKQSLFVYSFEAFPDDFRRVQNYIGDTYYKQSNWILASCAYEKALNAIENIYQMAATPESRQSELSKAKGLPAHYSYALLKMNHVQAMCQRALLVLEGNRARWLSESLALRSQKPIGESGSLWQDFIGLGKEIQALQTESRLPEDTPAKRSFLMLSELLRKAYEQLTATVEQIRVFAPDFMPQPSFAEIQVAAQKCTLVYLLTTTKGGLALIVEQNSITPVWLDQLTEETLEHQLIRRDASGDTSGGYLMGQLGNPSSLRGSLPDLLHWLGETILSPVASVLRQRLAGIYQGKADKEAITLIPCGRLSLLPLHAATYQVDGKITSFLDEFQVSFAPSARSLNHAHNMLAQRQQQSPVLLGVGNPLPVSTEQEPSGWHSLPNAKIELEEIAEQLNQETVYAFYETDATRTAVLSHLSTATLLHLSCHGMFDPNDALGSGLQLADGMFTLRELLDTNLYQLDHLRLAVLSACQTAITDFHNLPDESIGLPAGFLQAGAPGVVGSLWPVEDRATALLMRRFYQNFLDKKLEPSAALGEAQCWLRNLTWEDLGDYYRSFISRMSASDALQVYNQSVRPKMQQDPAGRPYENPYYWAGFTFTGV